jgi:hypothetical protein
MKNLLFSIAFILGIFSAQTSSLAQSCQPGGTCYTTYQCGSTEGYNYCGYPCNNATPGTCGSEQVCNSNYQCVCQPSGVCEFGNSCGTNVQGFDSYCGTPCYGSPTCVSGQMCSNNQCVCQPNGVCEFGNNCGTNITGFDQNCDTPCTGSPTCPGGQMCSNNSVFASQAASVNLVLIVEQISRALIKIAALLAMGQVTAPRVIIAVPILAPLVRKVPV